MSKPNQLTMVGSNVQTGAYLLRLRVKRDLKIAFGRFQQGKAIALTAGEYVYIGSAMNPKSGLARRLLRHASRSAGQKPHPIQAEMLSAFKPRGLVQQDISPPNAKKLHWHIDYVLDQNEVELTDALLIRSGAPLEKALGRLLEMDPCTQIIVKGLGAYDIAGNTHLLRVTADAHWWESLPDKLRDALALQ